MLDASLSLILLRMPDAAIKSAQTRSLCPSSRPLQMTASASSASSKQQWRPSGGMGQNRDLIDFSGNGGRSVHSASSDTRLENISSASSSTSPPSSSGSTSTMTSSSFASSSHDCASSTRALVSNKSFFLPYLPHDDAVAAGLGADHGGIDAIETQRVADLLNEELGRLLRMQPLEFWKAATMDSSIEVSLDSYLQFRRRWYDLRTSGGSKQLAGVIVGDQSLFRRVFMVLYRISLKSENRALPTNVNSFSEGHAEMIFQRRFFDIPKLLDICAIYGHDNQDVTRQLMKNAFCINEGLFEDLANIAPLISNTVQTMQQRCLSTLTMQLPTKLNEMSLAVVKIRQELLEVLDYLNDAVISLCTFVDVYWEGALVLVLAGNHSDSGDQILLTLETMHDSLIPIVRKTFSRLQGHCTDTDMESAVETRSKRLRFHLIYLVWRLFYFSHLKDSSYADSQDSYINHLLEMYVCNPKARGEGLVQILSGMVEESSRCFTDETMFTGALVRNVDRKYKLLERVNQLRKKGLISLDSVQYDYVEAIITHPTTISSVSSPNHSNLASVTQELSEEVNVLNESKISHIKDILPDYGAGFIAACLDAYDDNPEEVIQRILEGTLHPTLQSLDTALEVKPGSRNILLPAKDKGKGKIDEASSQKTVSFLDTEARIKNTRWQGDTDSLAQRRSSSMSASSSVSEDSRRDFPEVSDSLSAKDLKGRFMRKDKREEGSQTLLNERLADDVLLTAAYAAQYEDEYDDSFDDLGTSISDGVEEAESLVDLARSKTSVGFERSIAQNSKISSGARITGIGREGRSVNNGYSQEAKSTTTRENNSTVADLQKKGRLPASRGRGRGRRNEPSGQFYVKDGVNYSYKVAGSVAVASVEDAEALKKAERDTIYGLGQGGNVPISGDRVVKGNVSAQSGSNSKSTYGESSGRGAPSRGRGVPRKEHDHHHRKDRAMQKHFASVGGL